MHGATAEWSMEKPQLLVTRILMRENAVEVVFGLS